MKYNHQDDMLKNLEHWIGYKTFNSPEQELIIENLLVGNDVIAIMPTGSGKSTCFWYAAEYYHLKYKATTIVVTPLIALMEDQIRRLESIEQDVGKRDPSIKITEKIPAAMFSSNGCGDINVESPTKNQYEIYNRAIAGEYALIYVSPERLTSRYFIDKMRSVNIQMIVVDEAHCISLWGFDFRQSYLRIPEFIEQLNKRPQIAAFTATASKQVQQDIMMVLKMKPEKGNSGHITYMLPADQVTYERKNLQLSVKRVHVRPRKEGETDEEFENRQFYAKAKTIFKFLLRDSIKSKDGVIYFSEIDDLNKFFNMLNKPKTKREFGYITPYKYYSKVRINESAEARREEKRISFARFTQKGEQGGKLMLATNAFGMGVDSDNIDFVIHFDLPASIEDYYQEVGRAGRSGRLCPCVLCYTVWDIDKRRSHIETWDDPEEMIYPMVGSWLSDMNLELSMFKSYFDDQRFEKMLNLVRPDDKGEWKNLSLMERIVDYFDNTDEETDSEEFTKYSKRLLHRLKRYQDPTLCEKFLEERNLNGWEGRLIRDLTEFNKMLKEDMGGESPDSRTWERNLTKKLPEMQKQRRCFIYNDTKLAKNIRKGAKNELKGDWYMVRLDSKAKTDNTLKPTYTFYSIRTKKDDNLEQDIKLSWFDMIVADAVYTIWTQEKHTGNKKRIAIPEILKRLTGDLCSNVKVKRDERSRRCQEIDKSLHKMSREIFICFPKYKNGSPMFTSQRPVCEQKIDIASFNPFLPLESYRDKKGNVQYTMTETPLIFKYAEYLREFGTINADHMQITDENSQSSRLDFQNIEIQVYIAMKLNEQHKIIYNYRETNLGKKKSLKERNSHIHLYRRKNNEEDKKCKATFLCEQLQLNPTIKKQRESISSKVDSIMSYETYMRFIDRYKWDEDEETGEKYALTFQMYDPYDPEELSKKKRNNPDVPTEKSSE